MAISGTNCTNCLSTYDTYRNLQQREQQNNAFKKQPSEQQATEFIFRGELLDENNPSNSTNQKKSAQQIDPTKADAISQYEVTASANEPRTSSGRILDAYI